MCYKIRNLTFITRFSLANYYFQFYLTINNEDVLDINEDLVIQSLPAETKITGIVIFTKNLQFYFNNWTLIALNLWFLAFHFIIVFYIELFRLEIYYSTFLSATKFLLNYQISLKNYVIYSIQYCFLSYFFLLFFSNYSSIF